MASMIDVKCDYCGLIYQRNIGKVNEANKHGQKQFCSGECLSSYKRTSIDTTCWKCGIDLIVRRSDYERSSNKHFFCSKNCSASFNNFMRVVPDDQKKKTSATLLRRYHNGIIPDKLNKNRLIPYTKDDVIAKINEQYNLLNTTPSSKMVGAKLQHAANKQFGSQNKAIQAAGYIPNTKWMSKKKLICKDGHPAESISEMIVDNWLFLCNIEHERFKIYPTTRMTCDFYLPTKNMQAEYFGLAGEHREYDDRIELKRSFAAANGIWLVEIYASDLYPEIRLGDKIK